MKNKDYLTVRQEELMNFLWKVNEPLTANEMAERLAEDGWNNVTLFKTVQSLTTDGYLEVVGLEKTVKTYVFISDSQLVGFDSIFSFGDSCFADTVDV